MSTGSGRDVCLIVPAYNSAGTVGDTLASIQGQTTGLRGVRSVVLADDGSCDGTVDAARRRWHSAVPLVIRERASNVGEYQNVNEAVASLDQDVEWFLILHADDIAKPAWLDVIGRQIGCAGPSVGSICASWDVIELDGRVTRGEARAEAEALLIPPGAASVGQMVTGGCWWKITSCAIRSSAFRALRGLDTSYRQMGDVDFVLRMLAAGWSLVYVPLSLSDYRVHGASVTSRNFESNADLIDDMKLLRRFAPWLSRDQVRTGRRRRLHAIGSRMYRSLLSGHWRRSLHAAVLIPLALASGLGGATVPGHIGLVE